MARRTKKTNIRVYAVKSDDDPKPTKFQYPAYAVKSDDGTKDQH